MAEARRPVARKSTPAKKTTAPRRAAAKKPDAVLVPGQLLDEYERTVKAVSPKPEDAAIVEAGRVLARQIDNAVSSPDTPSLEVTKALYLMPHLVNVLRELQATPLVRGQSPSGTGGTSGGKLAAVRDLREAPSQGAGKTRRRAAPAG